MTEASINSEDKGVLVPTTSTIYPRMIERGAWVTVSFAS